MKFAVISDIHGNLEAFQAVLCDIEAQQADRIISLGDFIDYGPNPNEVTFELIHNFIPSILGNHEYALINDYILRSFSRVAYDSMQITRSLLSDIVLEYINTLPLFLIIENIRFVHGVPPNSALEYISQFPTLILSYVFESFPERIAFVGHTHTLGLYTYNGDSVTFSPIHEGDITLDSTKRHIVNAGSVGQPRDRDKHAKYVIYDTDTDNLKVRYVSYDVQETVKKIRRAGFPDYNATRLLEQ